MGLELAWNGGSCGGICFLARNCFQCFEEIFFWGGGLFDIVCLSDSLSMISWLLFLRQIEVLCDYLPRVMNHEIKHFGSARYLHHVLKKLNQLCLLMYKDVDELFRASLVNRPVHVRNWIWNKRINYVSMLCHNLILTGEVWWYNMFTSIYSHTTGSKQWPLSRRSNICFGSKMFWKKGSAHRAVFTWESKRNWICITTLNNWLEKLAPLFHSLEIN